MKPQCILVIDDEDILRELIQLTLETLAGWEVLSVDSGEKGIILAQTRQPDAILLDIMMPGMDGIETFKQLQSHPKTAKIPTILLTAKAQSSREKNLMKLGVKGLICKPFNATELVNDIKKILDWS